jgi:nickel superoxide dismutase
MSFNKFLSKILPEITAEAHCDIPCGIYEPTPAKIAAVTVRRMVEQIESLEKPKDSDTEKLSHYHNDVGRRIAVKEEHAELCKKELLILWTDFFKPEHLEKFSNLHETFWKAAKLCSKNKQEVNRETAQQLVDAVDEVAKIFYEVKGTPERFEAYKTLTDKLY